eukprot:TRINITY_DN14606_c0_g1_i1.p1 TRINITY_DN14606_c0_g1~~TRINITY_DN14606_c0_g1_i1.p1  ORF type:complete len:673 (-),score=116.17 TRINITY_DN14606_c0_g1_i1:149-2167(-)
MDTSSSTTTSLDSLKDQVSSVLLPSESLVYTSSASWSIFGKLEEEGSEGSGTGTGTGAGTDPCIESHGWIFLTKYRILLVSKTADNCLTVHWRAIRKFKSAERKKSIVMSIQLKDIRFLTLVVDDPRIVNVFQEFAFPTTQKENPAFDFFGAYKGDGASGWVYDPIAEYKRLGLDKDPFTITDLNKDYSICDTYPDVFVVPSCLQSKEIKKLAAARTRSRMPAIVWVHPKTKAIIVRCSQPKVGLIHKRHEVDENFMSIVNDITGNDMAITILDLRPKINAQANMMTGGGFESTKNYKNTVREFHAIDNIHKVRDAWKKLHNLCSRQRYTSSEEDNKKWGELLYHSQWFDYTRLILNAATRIRDLVTAGGSCFVHCSDGWDRTAQAVSLSQLMLDPYYRTLNGFIILIEKEWCSFGHQFALREGNGKDMAKYNEGQRAPIFLQFIDLVYQLTTQFPTAFEFNKSLLLLIMTHFHSCLFGNFLGNSEKERKEELEVTTKTHSLWSLVNQHSKNFLNASYSATAFPSVLSSPMDFDFSLWGDYFLNTQNLSKLPLHQLTIENSLLGVKRERTDIDGPIIKKLEERVKKVRTTYSPQVKDRKNMPRAGLQSSSENGSEDVIRERPSTINPTRSEDIHVDRNKQKRHTEPAELDEIKKQGPGNKSDGKDDSSHEEK